MTNMFDFLVQVAAISLTIFCGLILIVLLATSITLSVMFLFSYFGPIFGTLFIVGLAALFLSVIIVIIKNML